MANGTVFGFVILHGDFEHIIAAYTDAMDFRRFIAGLGLVCRARMLSWVRLVHERILTRLRGSARTPGTWREALPGMPSGTHWCLRRHVSKGSVTILRFGGSRAFDRAAHDGGKY